MLINQNETIKAGWKLDNSYTCLPKTLFSRVKPEPVHSPKLVIFNDTLADSLGLNSEALKNANGLATLSGNVIPEGSEPIAQAYAGHQFGYFTMLGDGRALLLGEHITPFGERFDIQLKGSGRTPYSRRGDGRAALGPMLREYIISESMYALGIPTTRGLAVLTTGEKVFRDTLQPGAILTRVASSHIRVGTFEYIAKWGSIEELRSLADYTIQRHFSYVEDSDNKYVSFLKEVINRQALLISKWQLVGFIHGVMNTDNMSLSGETIDYGPCAFMDTYDPKTVFSSIDTYGRYAYGNQPPIAEWNLSRFADTLLPLIHNNREQSIKIANDALNKFNDIYSEYWLKGMRSKLGILNEEQKDETVIKGLLGLMIKHKADFTNTFRALTINELKDLAIFSTGDFAEWHKEWQSRLKRQPQPITPYEIMKNKNPAIIPRNHRVEEALNAAVKNEDYSVLNVLLNVLSYPYEYSHKQIEYSTLPESNTCAYKTFCGT